jgi:hypothetical protein
MKYCFLRLQPLPLILYLKRTTQRAAKNLFALMKSLVTLSILFVSVFLLGCPFGGKDPEPSYIELKPPGLWWGTKYQVEIESPENYNWTVQDTLVGSINSSGLFTPRKIGETIITATGSDGKVVRYKITVQPLVNHIRDVYTERELLYELPNELVYRPESDRAHLITYGFDNGKLFSIIIYFSDEVGKRVNIAVWVAERFPKDSFGHGLLSPWRETDDNKLRASKFSGVDNIMEGGKVGMVVIYSTRYIISSPPRTQAAP